MKTTQGKAVRAYKALMEIQMRKEVTTTKTGRMLFDLKRTLAPSFDFQCQREEEIAAKLGIIIDKMSGNFIIPANEEGAKKEEQLANEFAELAKFEIEIDVDPVVIPESEELHLNMDECEALDGFIEFE